ncbi:hypothetical protein GALMADRAFT_147632 [Galerina marginata CBS 339.88]|uniref:Uncharacterized protein n=1 Tax=Galerina marginata (strain CBS 339.88) TaxID=685588 RepID=A0A067S7D0_GALM3|nr:hypothetical protein GALMADRAFT_147632 [Galerina marginata CBS 339.88]
MSGLATSSRILGCAHQLLDPSTVFPPCILGTITPVIDRHSNSPSGCRTSSWTGTSCAIVHYCYLSLPFRRPSLLRGRNTTVDLDHRSPYPSSLRTPSSPPFPSCRPSRLASSPLASLPPRPAPIAQVPYDGPSELLKYAYSIICAVPRPTSYPSCSCAPGIEEHLANGGSSPSSSSSNPYFHLVPPRDHRIPVSHYTLDTDKPPGSSTLLTYRASST